MKNIFTNEMFHKMIMHFKSNYSFKKVFGCEKLEEYSYDYKEQDISDVLSCSLKFILNKNKNDFNSEYYKYLKDGFDRTDFVIGINKKFKNKKIKYLEKNNIKVCLYYIDFLDFDRKIYKKDIEKIKKETSNIIVIIKNNFFCKRDINYIKKSGISGIIRTGFGFLRNYNESVIKENKVFYIKTLGNSFSIFRFLNIFKDNIVLNVRFFKDYDYKIVDYIPCHVTKINKVNYNLPISYNSNISFLKSARKRIGANFEPLCEVYRTLNLAKIFEILVLDLNYLNDYMSIKYLPIDSVSVYPNGKGNSVMFQRGYEEDVFYDQSEEEYYNELLEKIKVVKENGLQFVFSKVPLPNDINHLVVENPLDLHMKLCIYIRKLLDIDYTVAITGSVGKTSTKEMVYRVINKKYVTFTNSKNGNLQWQIGRNILNMKPFIECYVQEVGGGKNNGASNLSKMIMPNISVITNVGYSHLRWAKTREQLLINKMGIKDGLNKDGILLINIDNDMLSTVELDKNIETFSLYNTKANYYVSNLKTTKNGISFNINYKENGKVKKESFKLNVFGEHNVYNSLVAFAIGKHANVSNKIIKKELLSYKTSGIRQNIVNVNGITLYLDCFNSSLDSLEASIKTVCSIEKNINNKRVLVIGDITGMGDYTESVHKDISKFIENKDIDTVIFYGEFVKITYDLIKDKINSYHYTSSNQVCEKLEEIITPGDIVLFKGSSKIAMEENIVDKMFGTNFSEIRYDIDGKLKTIKTEDFTLIDTPSHVSIKKFINKEVNIKIPDEINNKKVTCIGKESFKNENLIKKVILGENITMIGDYAFSGCKNLEEIYIGKNVKYIGKNVFKNCKKLSIICCKDSFAYKYALENKIKVIVEE